MRKMKLLSGARGTHVLPSENTELVLSARCHVAFLVMLALASLIPVTNLAHPTKSIQISREKKRDDRFQLMRYLPPGATVKDRTRQIVFADLNGDGQQEVIIFYTLGQDPNSHQANITILTSTPEGYSKLWENLGDGSWGFAEPTGVFDINKTGRPQILAYRTVGASCSGSLEIYEFDDGIIKRLTGDWGFEGHCESVELKDLDGDGIPEVIIKRGHGSNDEIYRWNGNAYVRSNKRFPEYYGDDLVKLRSAIYSNDVALSSARIMWCRQAVQILVRQRSFSNAIQTSKDVLRIIADPALTEADLKDAEAKALVYRILGDAYKAAGNLRQARTQYQRAETLESSLKH